MTKGNASSKQKTVREIALDSLMEMNEDGVFLHVALTRAFRENPELSSEDRGFLTRLVEGTIEQRIYLDACLNQISKTKTTKMKPLILQLLRLSAYQILKMDRVPDFAVCNEAVKLASKRGFGGLRGFVNGVLRNLARKKETLTFPDEMKEPTAFLSVTYSMPEWIVERWIAQFGVMEAKAMLEALQGEKPLSFWVNTQRVDAEVLYRQLTQEGWSLQHHPYLPDAFLAKHLDGMEQKDAFLAGGFYVQDTSAMLAMELTLREIGSELTTGRILDVCAAPGGKTLYAANRLPEATFVAKDLTETKVSRIHENATRLGYTQIQTRVADATCLRLEDAQSADLVIVDVPCSGLGILGRKADIRYRVREDDIPKLQTLQRKILETAASYVKLGGYLLYATCTVTPEENTENVDWIRRTLPFAVKPFTQLPEGLQEKYDPDEGLQLLPHKGIYHDGFFAALFQKENETA